VRRTSYFAAFLLLAGIAVPAIPGVRNASAADIPAGPPAKILDSKLQGKSALAALKSKGGLAVAAARVNKTEAELSKILDSDASAGIDQTGAMFYVEPAFDPAIAAAIAAAPKPTLPAAAKPAKPVAVAPAPIIAVGTPTLVSSTQTIDGPSPVVAPVVSAPVPSSAAPGTQQGPYPYGSTFQLHSRGSAKVIYLDFTGHNTTTGSAWGVYTGAPYDTDGNPGAFSNSELDDIQSVFQRVSEDFAPFDIDVTTEDPGFEAINRTDASDEIYGTRIAFTSSSSTPICGGCGGNAYYGVINTWGPFNTFFDRHAVYQPAWVFPANVPGPKNMAEAASHEAGHTFGLQHDGCSAAAAAACQPGVEFVSSYAGHDNWAPIMGIGYYRPVTQWSKGEYAQANVDEDDLAIIAAVAAFLPDDYHQGLGAGGANEDLGVLSGGQVVRSGMTNQRDLLGPLGEADGDSFRFYSPSGGTVRFTSSPASTSPNLDTALVLYNPDGSYIDYAAPTSGTVNADVASGMDAVLTVDLPRSGYFHITVFPSYTDGTGDSGYTTYGSLGRYTLTVEPLSTSGDLFWPVTPARLLDTRPNPIPTGTTQELVVTGVAGVPSNATAVSLNIAAVGPPSAAGHLRVFPTGTPLPGASVLNFATGKNTPNHVIVKVGTGGKVSIYDGGTASVIVDINGYFLANAPGSDGYVPVASPTRILSTTLAAGATTNVTVLGAGGIAPSGGPGLGVVAVAVNVGAITPAQAGHLRVWPTGTPMPNASTNNFVASDSRMNLVIVKQSRPEDPIPNSISIFNAASGPVTLTVDTVGYFQWGGLGFKPLDPIRPLDTRSPANLVAAGDYREVQIRGFGSIPNTADVKAVVVNVAAVNPAAAGSIDVGPSGSDPALPSFTHPANENVANLVIVPVGADGKIRIRNNSVGTSHMIVDITGYFTD
jgi:hypothetical protein